MAVTLVDNEIKENDGVQTPSIIDDAFDMFIDVDEDIPKNVESYLDTMNDIINNDRRTSGSDIIYFDKDKYQTDYSFAMVSREFKKSNKRKIGFSVLLFTATGVDGLSPVEILERKRIDNLIEIPTISLDEIVVGHCIDEIEKSSNIKRDDIIGCSGFIVNDYIDVENTDLMLKHTAVISNTIAAKVYEYGYNVSLGKQLRTKLEKLTKLHYNVSAITGDCILDIMGTPYFTEWKVDVVAKENAKATRNRTSGKMKIGSVYGHIGCVMHKGPITVQIPNGQYGMIEQKIVKNILIPTVNISVIDATTPTDASILTLLLGALPIATTWKEILATNIKVGRNPGALNQIIDVNNEKMQGKVPKKIKINPSEAIDKKVLELSKFYAKNPVIVLDAPKFGFGSSELAIYVKASNGDEEALDKIMVGINNLTANKTAGKIDRTQLFVGKSIDLPDGTYVNGNGKRAPLSMLDEQRFAELTDDETLIIRFSNALSGKVDAMHALYPNAFDELMDIYRMLDEKFNTQISITGVRTRVFLNSAILAIVKQYLEAPFKDENSKDKKIEIIVPTHRQQTQTVSFADNSDLLNAGLDVSTISFSNGYSYGNQQTYATGNPYGYQM